MQHSANDDSSVRNDRPVWSGAVEDETVHNPEIRGDFPLVSSFRSAYIMRAEYPEPQIQADEFTFTFLESSDNT